MSKRPIYAAIFSLFSWSTVLGSSNCATEMKNIAVLGWGSLIWAKATVSSNAELELRSKWRTDGPELPVEFAKISRGRRLTLVILPGVELQQTYWALSKFEFKAALENLRLREGVSLATIHFLTRSGEESSGIDSNVRRLISQWLEKRKDIDAVIWTGLQSQWEKEFSQPYSVQSAMEYLRQIRATPEASEVEKYIRMAPPQIRTELRKQAESEFGWAPIELSEELFDSTKM